VISLQRASLLALLMALAACASRQRTSERPVFPNRYFSMSPLPPCILRSTELSDAWQYQVFRNDDCSVQLFAITLMSKWQAFYDRTRPSNPKIRTCNNGPECSMSTWTTPEGGTGCEMKFLTRDGVTTLWAIGQARREDSDLLSRLIEGIRAN